MYERGGPPAPLSERGASNLYPSTCRRSPARGKLVYMSTDVADHRKGIYRPLLSEEEYRMALDLVRARGGRVGGGRRGLSASPSVLRALVREAWIREVLPTLQSEAE